MISDWLNFIWFSQSQAVLLSLIASKYRKSSIFPVGEYWCTVKLFVCDLPVIGIIHLDLNHTWIYKSMKVICQDIKSCLVTPSFVYFKPDFYQQCLIFCQNGFKIFYLWYCQISWKYTVKTSSQKNISPGHWMCLQPV